MEETRIAELLTPFLTRTLSRQQLRNISMYIDILLKWNRRMNLTAVREPEQIVTRHFGESLFAAQALFPGCAWADAPLPPAHVEATAFGRTEHVGTATPGRPAKRSSAPSFDSVQDRPEPTEPEVEGGPTPSLRSGQALPLQRRVGFEAGREVASNASTVVDVGSGAGFPGLPIKIWAPDIRLTLIESNHKKATFLKEVVRALGLEGVEVFPGRAESFPAGSADVVTLRAVERFENILPIVAGLVKPGGRMALLIGSAQIEQAKTLARHLEWGATVPVPMSKNRVLLTGRT